MKFLFDFKNWLVIQFVYIFLCLYDFFLFYSDFDIQMITA